MKRPLYNKQSFTELGVCQLENIVTPKDRQKLMLYNYSILSVIIQIQYFFLNTIVARLTTQIARMFTIL